MVNMFSGGALSRLSIFAMGVMPYISASIIMQMMAMVVPQLHGVPQGRRVRPAQDHRDTPATARWCLALFQSFVAASALQKQGMVLIAGLAVPVRRHHHHDHGHDVPDVAG